MEIVSPDTPAAPSGGEAAARPPSLASWCNRLAHATLPSDYQLLEVAGLVGGHPWADLGERGLIDPGSVAYYRYLYGLARLVNPRRILEIGTGFGLSAAAFVQGAPNLQKLISLDLGVFGAQYEILERSRGEGWATLKRYRTEELPADGRNIVLARDVVGRLVREIGCRAELSFYQVNTQPEGTDNFETLVKVVHWSEVRELVEELATAPLDLLFIDGKHTGDGLYQDFRSFFPYVRLGGLVICDDIHDSSFPYDWAGQTLASFQRIREEFAAEIEDAYIWAFPQLCDMPGQEPVPRPFGLVRKRGPADDGSWRGARGPLCAHELAGIQELAGLDPEETVRRLKLLGTHGELLYEFERLGLDEQAVRHLAFVRDHPALLAAARELPLADDEAARLVRFVAEHPGLVSSLAAAGELPLADEEAAGLVRFVTEHPGLVASLASRRALADDLDRFQRELAGARWPLNWRPVKLGWVALKSIPGWLSGRYRR